MRTYVYNLRMWGEEIPGRIASKFCLVIGTQDVITCGKFGGDRLRGFWLAGGQIWHCDYCRLHVSGPSSVKMKQILLSKWMIHYMRQTATTRL